MLPSLEFTDLEALRNADESMMRHMPRYDPPVPLTIRDTVASDVPVRIYAPEGQDGPLPGVFYIHGGGFILGNVDMFDNDCKRIAAEVGAVVVSVEYRLAPENPFPAGLDDCYAALVWTAKSATELHIDPTRLAVGGDSAGGGLAAAVALLARDRGGPELCFQYLGIPELDDRLDTPSMRAYHDTPLWHRPAAEFSWDSYLGGPGIRGTEGVSPYAAPARMADLSGLPPTFVNVCQFDPLRDEGIAYAQRLAQANVPTELVLYPGTFHGSGMIAQAAITGRIISDQLAALRRALHPAV
ncbi:alpha/beta hydrolase [Amycolatopsis lurida]